MRLSIICSKCIETYRSSMREYTQSVQFIDARRYELSCKRGHKLSVALVEEKFEILFEIGVNAIIDGYYREAVSSFAAALERFYEYAARAILEDAAIADDLIASAWKKVSASSERQLGAFVFLWLMRFAESPDTLSTSAVALRNNVIHKGQIPTAAQAFEFGDAVAAVILPKARRIRSELAPALLRLNTKHQNPDPAERAADTTYSAMSIPTFVRYATWTPPKEFTVAEYAMHIVSMRVAEEREKSEVDVPGSGVSPTTA